MPTLLTNIIGPSNVLISSDIGSTVQAYDSNLTSFVNTFTLPTTDSTNGYSLITNGSGTLSFSNVSGGGQVDLTSISSNLVPSTDTSFSIGTLQKAFTDIFYSNNVKQQVDVFTRSIGLATAAANFSFRPNISKTYFTEVYTNSGGISTPALTAPTAFDDNNPAYRF